MNNREIDILLNYAQYMGSYNSFTQICHNIVNNYIEEYGIKVHSITSRTKDPISLWGKLLKKSDQYNGLSDCTDLSAVRVITFFAEDVDLIGSIIESNFEIDETRSIDKRELIDPDRFGYLSLHYVCGFTKDRLKQNRYSKYDGYYFEIQIRSLLQHAWAEIEHDYGYKPSIEVTREIRRNFSQIAGLLEVADQQFQNIKKQVELPDSLPKRSVSEMENIFIDICTVGNLIENNITINKLDSIIATMINTSLTDTTSQIIEDRTKELQSLGLVTTFDVVSQIKAKSSLILQAVNIRISSWDSQTLPKGISLFYLVNILIAECLDSKKAAEEMQRFGFGSFESQLEWANQLVALIKRVE